MAQRLIKIIMPKDHQQSYVEILEDDPTATTWYESAGDDSTALNILTSSERSEAIMDWFEKHTMASEASEGERLVMFPIEATLPRPVEESDGGAQTADRAQSSSDASSPIPLRISREELYQDIVDSTRLSRIYIALVVLSTIVAAIGLLKSNVAIIIGAMVIAPLLGPNVALALSTNLADYQLGWNAAKTLLVGVCIAFLLSLAMGYWLQATPDIPEIASRTNAGISDIMLALCSGCAGVLAFTAGVSGAVIGVMVAVALLPPLAASGMLMGNGYHQQAALAFLLFMTNIICINLSGILTFLWQGISPRRWWEADRAKRATRNALLIWIATLALLAVVLLIWQKEH